MPSTTAPFVYMVQTDPRPTSADYERAEWIARQAAGEEFNLFMGFCGARARRLVAVKICRCSRF